MALWSQEFWSCRPGDWKSWCCDLMAMYMPEHKQWKCWLLVQMAWTRSKLQTLPWAEEQAMSCWGNVLTQEEVADVFPPVIYKGGMSSCVTHRTLTQSRKNECPGNEKPPSKRSWCHNSTSQRCLGVEHTLPLWCHCKRGLARVTKPDIEGEYHKSCVSSVCPNCSSKGSCVLNTAGQDVF